MLHQYVIFLDSILLKKDFKKELNPTVLNLSTDIAQKIG